MIKFDDFEKIKLSKISKKFAKLAKDSSVKAVFSFVHLDKLHRPVFSRLLSQERIINKLQFNIPQDTTGQDTTGH